MLTVLATCWTFDKLVRLQYAYHRAKWEEDGKPCGFFFRPPESRVLGGLFVTRPSSWAFQKCSVLWVLSTPEWIKQDQRALRLVHRLRVLTLVSTAGVGVVAVSPSGCARTGIVTKRELERRARHGLFKLERQNDCAERSLVRAPPMLVTLFKSIAVKFRPNSLVLCSCKFADVRPGNCLVTVNYRRDDRV